MDNEKSKTRRKVLFTITGGVAGATQLPKHWAKPVIDSVVLPAHAQTSVTTTAAPTTTGGPTTTTTTTTTVAPLPTNFRNSITLTDLNDFKSLPEKILSGLIPQAYAQQFNVPADLCITSNDATSFTAKMLYDFDGTHFHEASGTVGGGSVNFPMTVGCFDVQLTISVSAISLSGADFAIAGLFSLASTLPPGMGCPSAVPCM